MKKILLTTTALIALGIAPAAAADMAARPYTKAPAAIAINNWGGFYLGAMGGYAQENSSGIGTLSGGFAGGTAGYNWQTGALVLGLEVDAAWADVGTTLGIPGIASLTIPFAIRARFAAASATPLTPSCSTAPAAMLGLTTACRYGAP